MQSTPNLIWGLPIRKGKTLLVFGHVGQGQRSRLLKIENMFPQHTSRRYVNNSKLGTGPTHKERKNPFHVWSCRSRSKLMVIKNRNYNSRRNHAINSNLGTWPAHKERKSPIDFGSCRPKSMVTVIFYTNYQSSV